MTSKLKTHLKQFAIGSLVAALGASAYVIAVTFSDFTTGTTISASEMNTKLNALKNAINATPVTVVTSGASVPAGSFGTAVANCPAGYYAIAGGVDPANVLTMTVTSSCPVVLVAGVPTPRMFAVPDGQHATPVGWHGAVLNNAASAQGFKVGVICAAQP